MSPNKPGIVEAIVNDTPSDAIDSRIFPYCERQYSHWVSAHARWWPKCADPGVWGPFARQAASGRYTFSQVNQPHRHFGETLVAAALEAEGCVCWTSVRVFRRPGRDVGGSRGLNTRTVEALLESSVGVVPQREYEREYVEQDLRLKTVDVVGYNCRRNRWVFAEVKKDRDILHPEQEAGLRFLRSLIAHDRAEVFVALVTRPTS